jgi:hypothetical protein
MRAGRVIFAIIAVFCGAGMVLLAAAPDRPGDQPARLVAAALFDAGQHLRRQILETPFSGTQTVQDISRRLGAEQAVLAAMQSATQRGSPRSPENATCEVRLELPGTAIAEALVKAHRGSKVELSERDFAEGIASLQRRTFSSIGVSIAAGQLTRIRPMSPSWRTVPDAARADALDAARNNAIAHLLDSIREIPVGGGKTTDDALAVPGAANRLRSWLAAQPVTNVEFEEGLEVHLTLAAAPDDFWPQLQSTLASGGFGPRADDVAAWGRLKEQFVSKFTPSEGRAAVAAAVTTGPAPAAQLAAIPLDPPRWANQSLEASGESDVAGLKGARAAETKALEDLRRQIAGLQLSGATTIGEAARNDPRVARALDEALRQAKVSRITYQPDHVNVRLGLDLEQLWQLLSAAAR